MMTVVLFRDLSHAHYQGGTVSKRARELKDLARQSVGPAAEQTNRLVPAVHDAALTAKDRLSPAVEQARERVVPLLHTRGCVLPPRGEMLQLGQGEARPGGRAGR